MPASPDSAVEYQHTKIMKLATDDTDEIRLFPLAAPESRAAIFMICVYLRKSVAKES
jgi:hypothetical protein